MSLETNIKGVRDYIVTKVQAAWATTVVSHEPLELVEAAPIASVVLQSVEIRGETPVCDEAALSFKVSARWARATNVSDTVVEALTDLRLALLADHNAGGFGYLGMVTGMETALSDPLSEFVDFSLTYECRVTAARA